MNRIILLLCFFVGRSLFCAEAEYKKVGAFQWLYGNCGWVQVYEQNGNLTAEISRRNYPSAGFEIRSKGQAEFKKLTPTAYLTVQNTQYNAARVDLGSSKAATTFEIRVQSGAEICYETFDVGPDGTGFKVTNSKYRTEHIFRPTEREAIELRNKRIGEAKKNPARSAMLPRYWVPLPNQTLAMNCIENASTAIVEFLFNQYCNFKNPHPYSYFYDQQNPQNSRPIDATGFDLSERWMGHIEYATAIEGEFHRFTQLPLMPLISGTFVHARDLLFERDDYKQDLNLRTLDPRNILQQNQMPLYAGEDLFGTRAGNGHPGHNLQLVTVSRGGFNYLENQAHSMPVENLPMMKLHLQAGEPVLLTHSSPGAPWHAVFAVGFDDDKQWLYVLDPSFGPDMTELPWYRYSDGSLLYFRGVRAMTYVEVNNMGRHGAAFYLKEIPDPRSDFCRQVPAPVSNALTWRED